MKLTPEEQARGAWGPGRREQALTEFQRSGYLVLEQALPPEFTATLREEYLRLLGQKMERLRITPVGDYRDRGGYDESQDFFYPRGGNHDFNRWNMHLPSRHPFFDERVFAHPLVLDLLHTLLGERCVLVMASSDTCFPHSLYQTLHQDSAECVLTVNIPLVDVTEDNGPMEVWPRTHLADPWKPESAFSTDPMPIRPQDVERYSQELPSSLMTMPAGSLLVRDQRVLHRGTPNLSDTPRPMLSLLYDREPATVPPRWLSDLAARGALFLREQARGQGQESMNQHLLNLGNRLGTAVEAHARSDRDYRRPLPSALWTSLSPRAQHLLRFGRIEDHATEDYQRKRSLRAMLPVLRETASRLRQWAREGTG